MLAVILDCISDGASGCIIEEERLQEGLYRYCKLSSQAPRGEYEKQIGLESAIYF